MEPPSKSRIGLCIFCYKSFDDIDKPPEFGNDNNERFFSLIARHFLNSSKVISGDEQKWWIKNAWKVISEVNSGSSSGNDKDKPFTCLIICGSCKSITEKWCELYDKVKELEILMDWQISKLGSVMTNADLDEVTCQKGGKILEECSISQELPLEDLRKSLKQSFQAYEEERKKEAFPRLSLSPVKCSDDLDDDDTDLSSLIKMEDSGGDFFEDDGFDENDSLEEGLELTGSTNEENGMATTTTTIKRKGNAYQRKQKILKANQGQDHKCPTCGKIFKGGQRLRYHQSQSHPEVFFPERFSKISVNKILKKMLDKDFTLMKMISSNEDENELSSFRFKCQFCSKILHNRCVGKTHLILRHRKLVEENLEGLSKEVSPSLKCDQCSEDLPAFTDKRKLFIHQTVRHLDKYFENGKMDNISTDKFSDYLRYLFKINVEDIWKRESREKCQYCGIICSGRRQAKNHLILRHFQILRDRLVGLQREFGEDGPPICEQKKKAIKNMKKPKRASTTGQDIKCNKCGKVFKASYYLRDHQSRYHPEVLFLPEVFSKISVAYVLEKQVEDHFEKIKRAGAKTRNGGKGQWPKPPYQFKCEICGNTLYNRTGAKSHLILVHLEVMRGKLQRLGESGREMREINEELDEMNKKKYGRPRNDKVKKKKKEETKKKEEIIWKCEGEGGGCGKVLSNKYGLQRHREKYCEVLLGVKVKGGEWREIDLNLEEEKEDGKSGDGEVVVEEDGIVKREEFENEGEEIEVFEDMELDGD